MLLKDEVTLFHQSTVFDESFFICKWCMTSSRAALWLSRLREAWSEQFQVLPFPWLHSLPPVSSRAQTHTAGADEKKPPCSPNFLSGLWELTFLFSSALFGYCWGHFTLSCCRLPHNCRWSCGRMEGRTTWAWLRLSQALSWGQV